MISVSLCPGFELECRAWLRRGGVSWGCLPSTWGWPSESPRRERRCRPLRAGCLCSSANQTRHGSHFSTMAAAAPSVHTNSHKGVFDEQLPAAERGAFRTRNEHPHRPPQWQNPTESLLSSAIAVSVVVDTHRLILGAEDRHGHGGHHYRPPAVLHLKEIKR